MAQLVRVRVARALSSLRSFRWVDGTEPGVPEARAYDVMALAGTLSYFCTAVKIKQNRSQDALIVKGSLDAHARLGRVHFSSDTICLSNHVRSCFHAANSGE